MLFNGRALIFTFSGTQVRIAEHERLQSLVKMSASGGCIAYIAASACRPAGRVRGRPAVAAAGHHQAAPVCDPHASAPATSAVRPRRDRGE